MESLVVLMTRGTRPSGGDGVAGTSGGGVTSMSLPDKFERYFLGNSAV